MDRGIRAIGMREQRNPVSGKNFQPRLHSHRQGGVFVFSQMSSQFSVALQVPLGVLCASAVNSRKNKLVTGISISHLASVGLAEKLQF